MEQNTYIVARRLPMTGRGYDFPVPIKELQIGTRFACLLDGTVWGLWPELHRGTVLWIGAGSVEVYWDTDNKTVRVQPELDVYILEDEKFTFEQEVQWFWANVKYGNINHTDDEAIDMAEVNSANPAVKALVARWNFQINALLTALEGEDKAKASITMSRLEKALGEATQLGVTLPDLPDALQTYEPLLEVLTRSVEAKKAKAEEAAIASSRKESTAAKHVDRAVAIEKHKVEAGAARPPKPTQPKKEKVMRPCLDGCGQMVPGNFAMGHDAKLKSLLIKIERGERTLDDIPEPCLDLVKIVKGEPFQDRDGAGNPKGEPKDTFTITAAPVKFPGRPEIALTVRSD